MKLAIVYVSKSPELSFKHFQYGPVDPITHLWKSLVWDSVI